MGFGAPYRLFCIVDIWSDIMVTIYWAKQSYKYLVQSLQMWLHNNTFLFVLFILSLTFQSLKNKRQCSESHKNSFFNVNLMIMIAYKFSLIVSTYVFSNFSDKSVECVVDTHSCFGGGFNKWNAIWFGHIFGLCHIHISRWKVTFITNKNHRHL